MLILRVKVKKTIYLVTINEFQLIKKNPDRIFFHQDHLLKG